MTLNDYLQKDGRDKYKIKKHKRKDGVSVQLYDHWIPVTRYYNFEIIFNKLYNLNYI